PPEAPSHGPLGPRCDPIENLDPDPRRVARSAAPWWALAPSRRAPHGGRRARRHGASRAALLAAFTTRIVEPESPAPGVGVWSVAPTTPARYRPGDRVGDGRRRRLPVSAGCRERVCVQAGARSVPLSA